MDKGPERRQATETPRSREQAPPPFEPDPRIAGYLEGGPTPAAKKRFRRLLERRAGLRQDHG